MNYITLDFETHYSKTYSLSKMTTQEYILHPDFEVIGVHVQVDGYEGQWFSGTMAQTKKWLQQFDWGNLALICQNTMFDAAILAWHFDIYPKVLMDTLCMSRALYPHEKSHSLKAQAERMGVGVKGEEVHNFIGYKRKDFTEQELAAYAKYCANDVDLTRLLAMMYLPRFKSSELKLIDSTLRIYTQPMFNLNASALKSHLEKVRNDKEMLLDKMRGVLNTPEASENDLKLLLSSNQKFATVLESLGVEPPTKISTVTGKEAFAFAKTDEEFKELENHEDPAVQTVVAARLGVKSTIEETRTQRLITCASLAPKVPIALRFYGAWTGRWSADSSGATNFQNIGRDSEIKRAVVAPDGYVIVGADLSNIELRLGLWLAGQTDKVDLIRNGLDLYKDLAAKTNKIGYDEVPKDLRQTYKVVNLSAIYQTGGGRLKETLRIMAKQKVPLQDAKDMIEAYRSDNAQVVATWEDCHQALYDISRGVKTPPLFRGLVTWDSDVQGFLLPSGLHLQMPNLRVEVNEQGKKQFVFNGAYGPEKTYGGKLFQGLTQALARCIIATGWLRINKKYRIGLSVHDSLYWLAPEDQAQEALDWGIAQMTAPVDWCPDLPLGAEGGFGKSLKDV